MIPLPTACACRGTLESASSAANDRARTMPAARTKARPRPAALRDDVVHISMITGTSPSDRLVVDYSITTVGSASRRVAGSSLVRRAFFGRPVWDNRRRRNRRLRRQPGRSATLTRRSSPCPSTSLWSPTTRLRRSRLAWPACVARRTSTGSSSLTTRRVTALPVRHDEPVPTSYSRTTAMSASRGR